MKSPSIKIILAYSKIQKMEGKDIYILDVELGPGELGEDTLLGLTIMKIHSRYGKPCALDICMKFTPTYAAYLHKVHANLHAVPDLNSMRTFAITHKFNREVLKYIRQYAESSLANKYILHVPNSIKITALPEVIEEANSGKCLNAFYEIGLGHIWEEAEIYYPEGDH